MRRKILRTFAAALFIISMLTVTAFAESATVTGSGVNVRTGPGTNYRVIDCLDYGTSVTVTDRSNSSWYAVSYNGVTGFISSQYLSLSGSASSDPFFDGVIIPDSGSGSSGNNSGSGGSSGSTGSSSSSGTPGYINANYVRFRSGPSTSHSILAEYVKGKTLTITGTSGNWTACIIDGRSGYVSSQYVTKGTPSSTGGTETPAPTPAPTPTPTPSPAPSEEPEVSVTPVESKAGHINGDYVRFRSGPSTSHSIINTYNKGKALTITGVTGDWTACTIDGKNGYVFSQYVVEERNSGGSSGGDDFSSAPGSSSGSEPGYITGNSVRLRSGPSTSANILGELFYGNSVTITGTSGDWTAVTYNGKSGYVFSQYVAKGEYKHTSSGGNSDLGREIADYALQFVGYKYTWGGASPSTGFDCSGLMYYVYKQYGYTLNRVANDQARNGVHVDHSDLQPGDILCFYSSGSYIGHVGMYIGNNKFVHAANSSTGVIITELSGSYVSRGYEARRII